MIPLPVWGIIWGVAGLSVAYAIYGALKHFKSDNLGQTSKIALPLTQYPAALPEAGSREGDRFQRRGPKSRHASPSPKPAPVFSSKDHSREAFGVILNMSAIAADYVMIVMGFVFANLLCQGSLIPHSIQHIPMPGNLEVYYLTLFASVFVLWSLTGKELYSYRNLLMPSKVWHKFISPIGLSLFTFLSLSVVVRMDPKIPRVFFFAAGAFILPLLYTWRFALSRIIRQPFFASRLRQRMIVIGGGSQTMRIKNAMGPQCELEFVGWVQANKPNLVPELDKFRLGSLHELGTILRRNAVNVAVLTESESLQREGVLAVAKACENEHVQFKMVPHFFEILISGVRPENIGGIQLLGVNCLPLDGYRNRFVKRTVDIIGALVGLTISSFFIAIFGALVYLESPGPIFYRQVRQGRNGRLFNIIKIRTMRLNAESNGQATWARENDNRRLRIGAFMRRMNIDEVPQFWNVLTGQMSLVGPRPERPELIVVFKSKIPHYQARHMSRPGMTGWAQVNGWRGNTDLEERIRYDIWYLEHWNVWLDFSIMIQTFYRRENAY